MSVWQANEEQFLEMRQRIAELEEKNLQLKADVADAVHLLVQAEAELAALKGAIKALVEDCCGWPPPNDTFCESFGCSTLFRLAEGEIRS